MSVPRPVVLDVELGTTAGSALALLIALASPEIELLAVTTVGRESLLRARIAARWIELAGARRVPVYAGCSVSWLGRDDFVALGHEGEGVVEPTEEPPLGAEHAVDALRRVLCSRDDVEIVAVGPLTNLAAVLVLEPDLAARIGRLTLLEGANLQADPHAAQVVLSAGLSVRLVPEEVTRSLWLTRADQKSLLAAVTPLHAALACTLEIWTPLQRQLEVRRGRRYDEDNVTFLDEVLTLHCAGDTTSCTLETLDLEPRFHDEMLCLVEHRAPVAESHPLQRVASIRADELRARLLDLASRLGV